jgi:hypothetical protein
MVVMTLCLWDLNGSALQMASQTRCEGLKWLTKTHLWPLRCTQVKCDWRMKNAIPNAGDTHSYNLFEAAAACL